MKIIEYSKSISLGKKYFCGLSFPDLLYSDKQQVSLDDFFIDYKPIKDFRDKTLFEITRIKSESVQGILHQIDRLEPLKVRRFRGRYFTKDKLGIEIADIVSSIKPDFIIEPYVGGGSLIDPLISDYKGVGNDINKGFIDILGKKYNGYDWKFTSFNIIIETISSIKMKIYTDVINSVNLYAANRYLALDGLSYNINSQNNNYHELFNDPRIVATNIIMHLLMYAGINPYNGRFLKPELFDGDSNTGIFGRHHLFKLDKHLFTCGATVTLPRSFHNSIEYLSGTKYGKEIQEKLLSTVNYMVLKNGLITLADIDYYLNKIEISSRHDYITFADLWKGGRTAQELNNFLTRWNIARNKIKKSKFYDMIKKNFELENGANPILEKYWGIAQNIITVYRMVEDFNDFSYLFNKNDKEFLKRLWKL